MPQIDVTDGVNQMLDELSLRGAGAQPQQTERPANSSCSTRHSRQLTQPTLDQPSIHTRGISAPLLIRTTEPPLQASSSGAAVVASQPPTRPPKGPHSPRFQHSLPLSQSRAMTSSALPQTKKKTKYYVITRGIQVGIFDNW